MVKKRIIEITIPEEYLRKEFGWFRQGMGERAVRIYLIKHPHIIEEGLNLEHFIGLDIWFKSTQEVDMLFKKNGTYYLIETKQKAQYSQGLRQLKAAVPYFEVEMKEHNEEPKEIVAVLATSSGAGYVDKPLVFRRDSFEPEKEDE